MASTEQLKREYQDQARAYDKYFTQVPIGALETELFDSALGTCPGAAVLDLGGGTGLRARQAVRAGASAVDVVDISPAMLELGQAAEAQLSREGVIRYLHGDVTQGLGALGLRAGAGGGYDMVMANWVMDHAHTPAELEAMWGNVAAHLKPGGRFVGVRSEDPRARSVAEGTDGAAKYGVVYKDLTDVPGGVHYRFRAQTDPPIEIEVSSMTASYSGSTEMHEKYGLCDVEVEPYENAEMVRKDPAFWEAFLESPSFAVVKARKRVS
ncbi:methyltransferase-like protein [Biscogniauxia mediterranea]|nr:methyltransferase-like protein [Biscogniauxia mediterranea]